MIDGLRGVVAAETALSDVDGANGRLTIAGVRVESLAGRIGFEALAARMLGPLVCGLPSDLTAALGAARVEALGWMPANDDGLTRLEPVEALRAMLARLPDGDDASMALRLIAATGVFTAAVARTRVGEAPVAPDPALGHAADVLRMTTGRLPRAAEAAALDAYLVTISDHGLNASTFAARVAASTRAGLTSAVLAGLSALKGPLHGGAPGPVIEMLDAIGEPERARAWIEAALDRGERLMGFGHRIYRVRDPRADALKVALERLAAASGAAGVPGRLAFAQAVEAAALDILRERRSGRPLDVNVEFYTALLLEALGFAPESFTCVFATGRVLGWVAHAREQVRSGQLIRPDSRYVGVRPAA